MRYEKIEKLTALIMAIAIIATLGMYINRQNKELPVSIESSDNGERVKVSVSGEVTKPGTYSVAKGARICDVLYSAGGVTVNADIDLVDLDALVMADTHITVPAADVGKTADAIPIIDINTADKAELMLIPGIGEVTAGRIIEYRESHGDFSQIDDIKNVRGIGEKTFSEIKDYIITPEINNREG